MKAGYAGSETIRPFFPAPGILHDKLPDISGNIPPFLCGFVGQRVGHVGRQINGDCHAVIIADSKPFFTPARTARLAWSASAATRVCGENPALKGRANEAQKSPFGAEDKPNAVGI
jgi:hypothetical protein